MRKGILWFWVYIGVVVGANVALGLGTTDVGFGLQAPVAVFVAGLAFTVRDVLQEYGGKAAVFEAILCGTAISVLVSPTWQMAIASGGAFALSELLDFLVYTRIRESGQGWIPAVFVSNALALVIDSALFLYLVFGSLDYLPGQLLAKTYVTVGSIFLLWLYWRVPRVEIREGVE